MIYDLINYFFNNWYWYVALLGFCFHLMAEKCHYTFMRDFPRNKIRKLENNRINYTIYNALFWLCMLVALIGKLSS